MAKMTEEEWQTLYDNFETTWLLTTVDHLDKVRGELADGDNWEPPQMRTDLLKLHKLAMDVVNNGRTGQARELFELADELDAQVSDMVESLEYIQHTLDKLTALFPESLIYDDDEVEVETT